MDDLSRFGIDMNDPSTWHIDINKLSDDDLDRVAGIKRLLNRLFGKDFADRAESSIMDAKKRKLHEGSTGPRQIHARLSPIITGSHTVSFYNDARDKIPSDLGDQDDSTGAEHCCDRCQLMTGTVEGLHALVSAEGYEHYTCDEARQQSATSGCAFCELIRRVIAQCKDCSESAKREGVIRVRGMAEEDGAMDRHPFRQGSRLEALRLEVPMDPERNSGYDSHHDHELGVLAFQGRIVN